MSEDHGLARPTRALKASGCGSPTRRKSVTPRANAHRQGPAAWTSLLARGERIYGVNTGVGGNVGISLAPEQMELLQHNLVRHLSCATGQPLPHDVVRAATLLRVATFVTGASAVRVELVEALAALLNHGITPVVPRYGSVGASGDLMPSAYIARVLVGMGEVEYRGAAHARAGSARSSRPRSPSVSRPKRAGADQRHHRHDRRGRAVVAGRLPRAARAAGRRGAFHRSRRRRPTCRFQPWVHETQRPSRPDRRGGLPARDAGRLRLHPPSSGQSCYSLRCVPQGLGPVWEALEDARAGDGARNQLRQRQSARSTPRPAPCTRPAISTAATSRACWTPGRSTSPPWPTGATR